jgi:predicted MFS family arabinose efflux permease
LRGERAFKQLDEGLDSRGAAPAPFSAGAEVRSRLNGLNFVGFFAGGAAGSALGAWVYATHGWHAALLTGMAFPGLALLFWLTEYIQHQRQSASVT